MKFCNNCGKKIENNEMFCGNCGKEVSSSANIRYYSKKVSIRFVDYFKDPIMTVEKLVNSLNFMLTGIICLVMSMLIAYVPYKPIKKITSVFSLGFGMFDGEYAREIKSKVLSLYFTFLILSIIFFTIGALVILIYGNIRGRKEDFIGTSNIFLLSSIPAVLSILLSSLILGINTLSIMIIILGFTLSTILLYSQLRKVLLLSEIEAFISLVLIDLFTYSITFYIGFIIIKDKLEALGNIF